MTAQWPIKTIGEVCQNASRRFDFSNLNRVRFINTGDVHGGKMVQNDWVSTNGLPGQAKKALKRGDTLYSEIRPGNKRFCFVDFDPSHYVVSTKFMVIEADKEKILPEYLYLVLKSKKCEQSFKMIAESRSGTFPQITFDSISFFEFSCPEIEYQEKICSVANALDDKIELNHEMNIALEEIAQAIFKDWFVDFGPTVRKAEGETDPVRILGGLIPDPAKATSIADLFPDSFNDEGLPQGWENGTLSDYANLNANSWKKSNHPNRVRYLDLKNTKWGVIEEFTEYLWSEAPSRARRIARPNDTLVGTVRPGNGSYTFISEEGYTASTGFAVLSPKETKFTNFVYIAATRRESIDDLAHKADGGAYPAVRPDVVTATKIVKADQTVMEAFENIVSPMRLKIEQSKRENQILAETRDYLLPKLMSGEVRVREAA